MQMMHPSIPRHHLASFITISLCCLTCITIDFWVHAEHNEFNCISLMSEIPLIVLATSIMRAKDLFSFAITHEIDEHDMCKLGKITIGENFMTQSSVRECIDNPGILTTSSPYFPLSPSRQKATK
jgi:hypothetical protein